MAENSKIEWTDHTFNAWVGCTKISPACDHCYAESWAKRTGSPGLWQGERRRTTASNWMQPVKWNRGAAMAGTRRKVFCASLADVFDNQVPASWRDDLWGLIEQTPHLDWLLLTKRPQNIAKMLPDPLAGVRAWGSGWPNVWLGTTIEDRKRAATNLAALGAVPSAVRFVSAEPLPELVGHAAAIMAWPSDPLADLRRRKRRPCPRHARGVGGRLPRPVRRRRHPLLHEGDGAQGAHPRQPVGAPVPGDHLTAQRSADCPIWKLTAPQRRGTRVRRCHRGPQTTGQTEKVMDQQHVFTSATGHPGIHAGVAGLPEVDDAPDPAVLSEGGWLLISTGSFSEQQRRRPPEHQVAGTAKKQDRAGGISRVAPTRPASLRA